MEKINRFLALVLLLSSCLVLANGNKFLETLGNEPDVYSLYNVINQVEWSTENLNIVQALWNKDIDKYPDLPWHRLDNDIIKLASANVLMQTHRHCRLELNMDELHDFVRSKTMSDDLRVRGEAILLLGMAGYEEDIPFLSSVVEAEEKGRAEKAVWSLTFIHTDAVLDALRNLQEKVTRPTLKDFLQEEVEEYSRYPLIDYSKGCEHKKTFPDVWGSKDKKSTQDQTQSKSRECEEK